MPAKAGQIVINISAGTSKFVQDLESAKGKIREFGAAGVSETKATTAAIKAMEGGFANNNRAAAAFFSTVLGGGAIMKAAFPVVGALAFAGVIETVGSKVYDFFKKIQEAPAKIGNAFRDLNGPLHIANDELRVTNDRLENDIAKLEGKRQNTLKLALDEAKLAADKLAESLDKDIVAINKILKEENVGFWRKVFGEAGIGDIQKFFGGATGSGGFRERMANANGATEEKALLQEALGQVSKWITEAQEAAKPHTVRGGGFAPMDATVPGQNEDARLEILRGIQRNLSSEMERIGLEQQGEKLKGQKGALEPAAGQAARDAETLKRLQEELAHARESELTGLEKVNAEEADHILQLQREGEYTKKIEPLVSEIYDAKRIAVYNEEMKKLATLSDEIALHWQKLQIESGKLTAEFWAKDIEEGKKAMEQRDKSLQKWAAEYNRINNAGAAQKIQHDINMLGAGGDHGNPLALLAAQQDIQRQAIMDRYNEALKTATTNQDKALAIRQKDIDLLKLQYEWEEKSAQLRQKGVKDFFLDMQAQAQTAGNILYEAMHSALDRTSDQLAKLFTGQKTSFGKMFQGIGEQMVKESIKSELQRGLGALGKVFGVSMPGKRDGSSPNAAIYVQDVNGGLNPGAPGPGPSPSSGGRIAGGILGSIGGVLGTNVGKFGGFMAEGGAVDPGSSYIVGEHNWEVFTPRTAGTITPASQLGSGSHTYNIDARGADLGAANRVARAIDAAHVSAVANAVRATAERNKRIPDRKAS